ncbi:D-aminoacyl-tRNA deacylase [Philodulcilactobacillus myokoensis]|uniref:D-aminoacyl-tRNA deacylase n=1 Tax=Philodulcilactobacillus myokoensis TaxID=2929573 RepID=A0A9W6B0V3_9LACO|nr:D-aminoacyl-tRNA deacylase [Philodulcilactobacillus myokoensis]GLB46924.1 D-aminoacyl-tRNA deacylase [Philodulcilactobacillus myokoensis]
MKVVLQRVNHAKVSINGKIHGQINRGYMLLVGVEDTDGQDEIDYLVHKISKIRIFEDDRGKMNNNLSSVNGSILSISQFTLYANTAKGNRPSFFNAGKPDHAKKIYDQFNHALENDGIHVATGVFGADMQVELENDGPVTIIFDTDNK